MKRDGNMCKRYLNLEGECFLNGSVCCNPFSVEGCDIQCRDIFNEGRNTQHLHYEPDETDKRITKLKARKCLGIQKGDVIAEWIIPYDEMEALSLDPGIAIHHGIAKVNDMFYQIGLEIEESRVFHNVEVLDGKYGVYIVAVRHMDTEVEDDA